MRKTQAYVYFESFINKKVFLIHIPVDLVIPLKGIVRNLVKRLCMRIFIKVVTEKQWKQFPTSKDL